MIKTTFRQCFELETDCKKAATAISRFARAYPQVEQEWGATDAFEYMLDNGLEKYSENGWCFWCYCDEQCKTHYLALVITDEYYKVEEIQK